MSPKYAGPLKQAHRKTETSLAFAFRPFDQTAVILARHLIRGQGPVQLGPMPTGPDANWAN
jgi:hypothetical protein